MRFLARLAATICALTVAGFAPQAAADPALFTGADLIKNCGDAVTCRTYLSGLLDADETLSGWNRLPPQFCPQAPQPAEAIWPVIKAFFEAHTDQLPHVAGSVALIALENGYRCPAGAASAQPALSRYYRGAELNAVCQSFDMCQAFIIGVMEAHQSLVGWNRIRPMICAPVSAQNRDLILAVADYVGTHPNDLGYTAGSVVLLALVTKYPCGR